MIPFETTIDLWDQSWEVNKEVSLGGKVKTNRSEEDDWGEKQWVYNMNVSSEVYGNTLASAKSMHSWIIEENDGYPAQVPGTYEFSVDLAYTGRRAGGAEASVHFLVEYPDGNLNKKQLVVLDGKDQESPEGHVKTFNLYQEGEYHVGIIIEGTASAGGGGAFVDYRANPIASRNRHINIVDEEFYIEKISEL